MSQDVAVALEDFNRDFQWFLRSQEELLDKHRDQWLAIQNEKILDSDKDLTGLVRRLKSRGLKPEQMLIQFLPAKPIEAIL